MKDKLVRDLVKRLNENSYESIDTDIRYGDDGVVDVSAMKGGRIVLFQFVEQYGNGIKRNLLDMAAFDELFVAAVHYMACFDKRVYAFKVYQSDGVYRLRKVFEVFNRNGILEDFKL